ncbi:glycosyltransferase family 4 protein [Frigoribacterium sp. PhB24]|uniref:glycosyltransferase family 4 protein n=1 Tax=Frigoribacterium sp. PhB24 TaxID=2485204 RepID=UPI000FC32B9B|nr:glycosyltransferase family 4 protein [Frigoribacterium sp. PhB24]ROS50456.1 glycosyltransferase involved in cell wall biosynthesis [Frigoribacterium sp. PhB24]
MSPTRPSRSRAPRLPAVRLYESLRTAHLERAHDLAPASIVYRVTRYDFDASLAEGLDLVPAGPLGSAWLIARSRVETLEVNEPLMTSSLPTTAMVLAALAVRRRLTGRRTIVVSYLIGNADPFDAATAPRLRTRLRRRGERLLARAVWRRLDRVVFGTDAARETYTRLLGDPSPRTVATTVPALPTRHPDARGGGARPPSVAFVGSFVERKGLRVLAAAWPLVVAARPDATLTLLGKGTLEQEVRALSATQPSVTVEVDPPRPRIHSVLDEARVLVLWSQPSPTWREQVGLPIVEGLSHGCTVVTTTETGLADWLGAHGHVVAGDPRSHRVLADAIVEALDAGRTADDVLADLPDRDGRLAADDRLFGRVS